MDDFLQASLSYPTVLFTVLLGVMLLYWLLVILGAVGLDLLGGHDHGVDVGHHADGVHPLEAADATEAPSAFRLRQVPVTVSLSLLVFWGWLLCHLGSHYLLPLLAFLSAGVAGTALLLAGALGATVLTKLCVAPLAPLFHTHQATRRQDLVGQMVTIRTGRVDRKFGQALLDDKERSLLLEVRCDAERGLKRGQRVLVISVDDEGQSYEVEPIDELLDEAPKRDRV